MTKDEQARLMTWRSKILQHASGEQRTVAQTCRYFGIARNRATTIRFIDDVCRRGADVA